MARVIGLLITLALAAGLAGSPAPAQIRIEPIPPHVKPQWTTVPGAPQVYYAPNIPTDVFRYRGKYYFFWEGYLYRGNRPTGPWKDVKDVPAWFYQIDPAYFKTARKEGAPAPPPAAAPSEPTAPAPPAFEMPQVEIPPPTPPPSQPEPPPALPPAAPEGAPKPPQVM